MQGDTQKFTRISLHVYVTDLKLTQIVLVNYPPFHQLLPLFTSSHHLYDVSFERLGVPTHYLPPPLRVPCLLHSWKCVSRSHSTDS